MISAVSKACISGSCTEYSIDYEWSFIFRYYNRTFRNGIQVTSWLSSMSRGVPTTSIRVVGMEVALCIMYRIEDPLAFDVLLAELRSCPTTLVITFCITACSSMFEPGYKELQECVKKSRPFNWNSQMETHTIIFTYKRENIWIGIDPVTLSPTGEYTFK